MMENYLISIRKSRQFVSIDEQDPRVGENGSFRGGRTQTNERVVKAI